MDRAVYFPFRTVTVRSAEGLSPLASVSRATGWNRPGRVSLAGILLVCMLGIVCLPVILSGTLRGRAAYDSINYHEKVVRQFAQELPNPKLDDYLSATTPGYHLTLAGAGRATGVLHGGGVSAYEINLTPPNRDPRLERERRWLQVLGLGYSLCLLYLLGAWIENRLRTLNGSRASWAVLGGVALALPMAGSPYVFQSAAWLLPDNAAWLGVLALLVLAMRPQGGPLMLIAMGGVLVWIVLTRQVHAWGAGLVWATAWLNASMCEVAPDRDRGPLLAVSDLLPRRRLGAVAASLTLGALCTLPAALVLWLFWRLWDGQLVPPTFVTWHGAGGSGVQLATCAFVLSLIALVSPFFGGWLWHGLLRAWHEHRVALVLAMVLGLLLAAVGQSSWSIEQGRFGAVWNVYKLAGDIGERSIALLVLAPLGAAVVSAVLVGLDARRRWVMLAALAGFAVANSFNPQLWQRYHEPFVLMWLALGCAAGVAAGPSTAARRGVEWWRIAGPVLLALLIGVGGAWMELRKPPQRDQGYRPGQIETPPQLAPRGVDAAAD